MTSRASPLEEPIDMSFITFQMREIFDFNKLRCWTRASIELGEILYLS